MKVLLPIDNSPRSAAAVQAVIHQFQPDQTELRVVHAVDWTKELPTYLAFAEGPTGARDVLDARGERMEDGWMLVTRIAEQLKAAGFPTSTDVREGTAADVILEAAAEWHPDVILMGSHSRHGMDRVLHGSVAEHVMRHAACGVEVIPVGAIATAVDSPPRPADELASLR
jgi:nucleotide-binding universal stress UspA family protein